MAKRKKIKYSAALARRRNEQQARLRAENEQRRDWWNRYKKPVIALVAAAAAVLLIALIVINTVWGPGFSLPVRNGAIAGLQPDWIVTNTNPRTNANYGSSNVDAADYGSAPRYYHLATLSPIAGFTRDEAYDLDARSLNQDLHYIADDEGGVISAVYVFGIPNKTAAKHIGDLVSVMSLSEITAEIREASVAGHQSTCTVFTYKQEDGVSAYRSLCVCIDTPRDACVLAVLNSPVLPMEQLPTDEAMLAEAERILPNLTIAQ